MDQARALYEEIVRRKGQVLRRDFSARWTLSHERLARCYEALNQHEKAAEHKDKFPQLWKGEAIPLAPDLAEEASRDHQRFLEQINLTTNRRTSWVSGFGKHWADYSDTKMSENPWAKFTSFGMRGPISLIRCHLGSWLGWTWQAWTAPG